MGYFISMKIPTLYKQYSFTSSLSREELSAKLRDYLTMDRDSRSYYGTSDGDKFEIKRIVGARQTSYMLNGIVSATNNGSTVSIEIAPPLGLFLIQIVVFPIILSNFFRDFSHPEPAKIVRIALLTLLWIVFSYVVLLVGIRKELKRSKEFLLGLLQGKDVQP
jgi:hypothetical protein